MWKRNKRLAAFLAVTTSLQVVAPLPVVYASVSTPSQREQVKQGTLTTQIQFDYPVTYNKVKTQNIKVNLMVGEQSLLEVPLNGNTTEVKNGYTVEVVANLSEDEYIEDQPVIESYTLKIQGVDEGDYTLKYEGTNYATYETNTIKLKNYSKEVIVHTGKGTFSYGDVDGSGQVDNKDLETYKDLLQSEESVQDVSQEVSKDLNGDEKIDIVELTYVTRQISAKGTEIQRDTTPILSSSTIAAVNQAIEEANLVVKEGSVESLLTGGAKEPVKIEKQNPSSEEPIAIPIPLGEEEIETQVVEIVSPVTEGGITSGAVVVTYIDEEGKEAQKEVSFGEEPVDDAKARMVARNTQSNSIVIDLGERVPVKQVTIIVNKVVSPEGKTDFVVLEEINFIKDILPDGPIRDESVIENVSIIPGDKQVTLKWNPVNNVEGYRIDYGTQAGKYTQYKEVNTPEAVIGDLENLTTYYFAIRAISGDWQGTQSKPYQATPQPSAKPGKPDNINIEPMDRALRVSWKKTEDATYYKVFYKKKTDTEYKQWIPVDTDGTINGLYTIIGNLENGEDYQIYVVAGNKIGEGAPSVVYSGTPKSIVLEGPNLPERNKISNKRILNITMTDPGNIDKPEYPTEFETEYKPDSDKDGIKNIVDGNYATHWTAQAGQYSRSEEMTYTFDQPIEMDYLIYVDRLDRKFNQNWAYTIRIWEDDTSKDPKVSYVGKTKRAEDKKTGEEYYIVEFPKSNVKRMSLQVEQDKYSSISEIVFYEYDRLANDITQLFADGSFTTLAKGVTQETINVLKERLTSEEGYFVQSRLFQDELELAEKLLKSEANATGIIKDNFISIDASKDVHTSSTWSPLGIVAKPSTEMTIYAEIPKDETLEIIPTQYYAEAGKFQGTPIRLTSGRNTITIPQIHAIDGEKGGALYYRYTGSQGDKIKLQIRDITSDKANSVRAIPTLELYNWSSLSKDTIKQKISDYIDELTQYVNTYNLSNQQTNPYNSTEISGRNILLSLPADQVLNGLKEGDLTREKQIDRLYNALLAWEEVISVVHTTYGLENPLTALNSRQNIRYMRMFGKAFMYAAGTYIGIGYKSVSPLVQGEPTSKTHEEESLAENKLYGWGIAHEIGHNMDRIGKAEITNNIYSLMLQTYDGKDNILKSRLELSNKYEEMYKKVAIGGKGLPNDVFTQLGMYWQLHLAYDDGQGADNKPLSFYHKVFKLYDEGAQEGFEGDEAFAVVASKAAGKNLTEFFTQWGIELSDKAKAVMATQGIETRKIQYLQDESRRRRLVNNTPVESISLSAKAELVNAEDVLKRAVKITIEPEFVPNVTNEDILGYEIFKDGEQIAFVTKGTTLTTYEDYLGSVNNRVFEYEVRAIDMLGNVIGNKVSAGAVEVKHDNEITTKYTATFVPGEKETMVTTSPAINATTGPAIMIQLDEQTPVTGIKINENLKGLGKFTIEVGTKDDEGNYTYHVVKQGDFSNNDSTAEEKFINYFNKPGIEGSDTSIWTYSADVIRITGEAITQDFYKTNKIILLGHPGDHVEFIEQKMAKMAEAYGDIPKDALVIVGNFRGNPAYNLIHIEGRFMEKDDTDKIRYESRPLNGKLYLFAKEDVSTAITDGFFIFVPDFQKEAELQGKHVDCLETSLLPTEIRAQMYYLDNPTKPELGRRLTSQTLWYTTPSYETLPELTLQNSKLLFE